MKGKKIKCATKFCRNTQPDRSRFCHTCASRKHRKKFPVRYAYDVLKMNAKRRGKEFDLTFADFKRFCRRSDYIAGKGRTKESYCIDRRDNKKGYTKNNIQILTISDNSKKGARILVYDWHTKYAAVI